MKKQAGNISFEILLDYATGSLSGEAKRKVEAHLAEHPTDRQVVEGIRLFMEKERASREDLTQYLDEQDHNFAHIRVRHHRNRLKKSGRWAAALATAASFLLLGWFLLSPVLFNACPGKDRLTVATPSSDTVTPSLSPGATQEETLQAPRFQENRLPSFTLAPSTTRPVEQKDTFKERTAPLSPTFPSLMAETSPALTGRPAPPEPESIRSVSLPRLQPAGFQRMTNQMAQLTAAGSFSPGGQQFLLTSMGRRAVLADPVTGDRIAVEHGKRLRSAVMSPDGQYLLTASDDRTARLWDRTGRQLQVFRHRKAVFSAVFSPNGRQVLTTSDDNRARLWGLQGEEQAQFLHKRPVFYATFSPDGQRVLTASDDNTARLWDLDGDLLVTYPHERAVFSANFSPDGRRVLTASDDNTARLWQLDGQQLAVLPHNRSVRSAVFSPDGQKLLTASWDKTARLWDLSGKLQVEYRHQSWVYSAHFSPDGANILTTTDEREAHLWKASGKHLTGLKHDELVISAVFSPDGQRLLSSSRDQVSKIWDLQGNKLGEIACPC